MHSNPETIRLDSTRREFEPSWIRSTTFINAEHQVVATGRSESELTPTERYKLYEIGYYCGTTVLCVGTGTGHSASLLLQGALARPDLKIPPMLFGLCKDTESLMASVNHLQQLNLLQHALLFCGSLSEFIDIFRVNPTSVILRGLREISHICSSIVTLSRFAEAGTPMLVHDFENAEGHEDHYGVKLGCEMCAQENYISPGGRFGSTALYFGGEACTGVYVPFSYREFKQCQNKLAERYQYSAHA